jgi:hypothetical protein
MKRREGGRGLKLLVLAPGRRELTGSVCSVFEFLVLTLCIDLPWSAALRCALNGPASNFDLAAGGGHAVWSFGYGSKSRLTGFPPNDEIELSSHVILQ